MIRINKHLIAPESLAKRNSWTADEVCRQLGKDQYDKCYLCEKKQVSDFEVDHLRSQENNEHLKFEWTNLFWSCGYCNRKKSSNFDNLLDPTQEDIEDLIKQTVDFINKKVCFESFKHNDEKITSTIELLNRIFNGSKKLKNKREENFYNYFISIILDFQSKVNRWLDRQEDKVKRSIIEDLNISSEFLGFKYWIIKSSDRLFDEFGQYLKWNKK